jgi:glycosyltransferase 2 family protein
LGILTRVRPRGRINSEGSVTVRATARPPVVRIPAVSLTSRRLLPLHIALWLVPIAGVVFWARTQQAPTLPDTAGAGLELIAALAVYVVATLARSERWHAILTFEGIAAKRADTYALVPVGYMGNNALPARAGELLRVFLLGSRTQASRKTILGTIIVERLLDAMALGILLVVLAANLIGKLRFPHSPVVLAAVAGVVVAVLIALALVLRSELLRPRLMSVVVPLLSPARQLVNGRGAVLFVASLAIWTLEAAVYVLVARAASLHIGLHDGLSVVAFTNLCALIPAAPGYIGTYDGALLLAAKTVAGVGGRAALSYLILLRFALFVPITVVGLVILFVRYGGLSRLRAARAQASTP